MAIGVVAAFLCGLWYGMVATFLLGLWCGGYFPARLLRWLLACLVFGVVVVGVVATCLPGFGLVATFLREVQCVVLCFACC